MVAGVGVAELVAEGGEVVGAARRGECVEPDEELAVGKLDVAEAEAEAAAAATHARIRLGDLTPNIQ